jgi:NAD+ kinase
MKTVGVFANTRKPNVVQYIGKFFSQIAGSELKFLVTESIRKINPKLPANVSAVNNGTILNDCDLIVAIGGDGTILRTIHSVGARQLPVLGVNMGRLGFLAETAADNAPKKIQAFFDGQLEIQERSLLQIQVDDQNIQHYALNDFVIDKGGFARVIRISTRVDGQLLNSYIADGVIIATPTGSTAYSLANGGPIVMPGTDAFIISPICPHTLSNRPVVIPEKSVIEIDVQSELGHFSVFGDGKSFGSFDVGTRLRFSKAPFYARLVRLPERHYYNILREKLGWGEDFREKDRW